MAEYAVKPYVLKENEKVTAVMAYTQAGLYWGEVVTKTQIRVSTWLRTNVAPDYLTLYNAHFLLTVGNSLLKPVTYRELHVSTSQVLAYHLVPPGKDPADYDANEPNRKFEPVTALVGTFRIDGSIRMATISSLAQYLDVTREEYTPLYNCEISQLNNPALGCVSVPYALVRQEMAVFTAC